MTFTGRTRAEIVATVGVALLVAALTWSPMESNSAATDAVAVATATTPVAPSASSGLRVVLLFGDRPVEASLADAPPARELAAMLPVTVEFGDAWGQAKTGRLPHPLTAGEAPRTMKPTPGGIYYWPDTATLAIYYDDLGQTVPPPGLIRLGALDTDRAAIADTDRKLPVRIDWAAKTRR
jgi:hypothetical protein